MHGKYLLPGCDLFFSFSTLTNSSIIDKFLILLFIVFNSINLFHYSLDVCMFCLRNSFPFKVIKENYFFLLFKFYFSWFS